MTKEEHYLNQMLAEGVDVELMFIKTMLDKQVTTEKLGGDYGSRYENAPEEVKWRFAKLFKDNYNRNLFMWCDFIGSMDFDTTYNAIFPENPIPGYNE